MKSLKAKHRRPEHFLFRFLSYVFFRLRKTTTVSILDQVYRITRAAVNKFLKDDCFIRANSIAYAVAFSIIPLLAVMVRFANVDKDDISANLVRFMAAYGLTDSTEVLIFINRVLSQAKAIAYIGAVIMIITATNLIFYLEDAFNYIYRAATSRPLLYRLSIFISALVLLPGLFFLSSGVFRTLINRLNPPVLNHIAQAPDAIWITGTDGILRIKEGKRINKISLNEKVETDATSRSIYFDMKTGRSGFYWEIVGKERFQGKHEITHEDFTSIKRVATRNNLVYVLSESGTLFYSEDAGNTWDYRIFRFKSESIRSPITEDIHIGKDGAIFILATVSGKSCLIRKKDSEKWRLTLFNSVYHRIYEFNATETVPERVGLYLSGSGRYLFSDNNGLSWKGSFNAQYRQRNLRINVMLPGKRGEITFAGAEMAMWRLHSNQVFDIRSRKGRDILGVYINEQEQGFLYGKNGLFRYTVNGGETWLKTDVTVLNRTTFFSHTVLDDGSILLVGENETLYHATWPALTDRKDEQGFPLVHLKQITLTKFHFLKSAFLQFLLFLISFTLILVIFFLGYRFLPNAEVGWRPALIGSAITSTALVLFVIMFRLWILTFSSTTVIIYGVWATIPVTLLLILISTQIILFGLELSYIIQHPHLYQLKQTGEIGNKQPDFPFWNALLLTSLVYHRIYSEQRPLENEKALEFFNGDIKALELTRNLLTEYRIIFYDDAREKYFPVRSPHEIRILEIQKIVLENSLGTPPFAPINGFHNRFLTIRKELFQKIDRKSDTASIADLLPLLRTYKTNEKRLPSRRRPGPSK